MRSDPPLARLGVTLSFAIGFQVLYVLGLGLVLTFVVNQQRPADATTFPRSVILADGQPLVSRGRWLGKWSDCHTLDGREVKLKEKQPVIFGVDLNANSARVNRRPGEQSASWSTVGFTVGRSSSQPWYVIHEFDGRDHTAYFVNYSNATHSVLTYLGTNGESATVPPQDQRFQLMSGAQSVTSEDGLSLLEYDSGPLLEEYARGGVVVYTSIYLLTKGGLDRVDLSTRRVSRVVTANDLESLSPLMTHEFDTRYASLSQVSSSRALLVRGSDTLFQIENDQVLAKYQIPGTLQNQPFSVYTVSADTIFYGTSHGGNSASYAPNQLFQSDPSGRILKEWEIPQPPPSTGTSVGQQLSMAVAMPTPLQIPGAIILEGIYLGTPAREVFNRFPMVNVLVILCGILSALGAWQLAPRFSGAPAERSWLVFVFVTGLPGLIGYLMHFRHRRRPPLEPNARLGTEIFA